MKRRVLWRAALAWCFKICVLRDRGWPPGVGLAVAARVSRAGGFPYLGSLSAAVGYRRRPSLRSAVARRDRYAYRLFCVSKTRLSVAVLLGMESPSVSLSLCCFPVISSLSPLPRSGFMSLECKILQGGARSQPSGWSSCLASATWASHLSLRGSWARVHAARSHCGAGKPSPECVLSASYVCRRESFARRVVGRFRSPTRSRREEVFLSVCEPVHRLIACERAPRTSCSRCRLCSPITFEAARAEVDDKRLIVHSNPEAVRR